MAVLNAETRIVHGAGEDLSTNAFIAAFMQHGGSVSGTVLRSDGQISIEVGGFRFSSGGMDEKKNKWNWGTNKKEKGWFD